MLRGSGGDGRPEDCAFGQMADLPRQLFATVQNKMHWE